jgi:Family of unknown function (DUF6267)
MNTFQEFLIEAMSSTEEKLTHLEHAEDHVINAGHEGVKHAIQTLQGVHDALAGHQTKVGVTTKYDGSPSLVFGHHPKTGKFFVGTKSVFNKEPKINYTHEDIDKNHGHSPGLASKLHAALTHMPKVTPKGRLFQGDIMHTPEDVHEHGGSYHFKPNTITYSTKTDSAHGKAIKNSKIGVAVHTEYKGSSLDDMKAHYGASTKDFPKHSDVHVIDAHIKPSSGHFTPEARKKFNTHMSAALNAHNPKGSFDHLEGHRETLKTYINSTVRTGDKPSVEGYTKHLIAKHNKDIDSVKTEKAKDAKKQKMAVAVAHVHKNANAFKNTLDIHRHLQAAKDVLVHSLSTHQDFHHSINGKATKPEGFVAVKDNRPTKLVDRAEFSRANFAMSQNR